MPRTATPSRFLSALLCGLLLATAFAPAHAQDKRPALDAAFAGALTDVTWSAERDVPLFLSGALRAADGKRGVDAATAFLAERAPLFGLANADAFRPTRTEVGDLGDTHVRVQQTVDGVPVFGAESIVHLDRSGAVYAFNGDVYPEAATVATQPSVSSGAAISAAQSVLDAGTVYRATNVSRDADPFFAAEQPDWTPTAELVVYPVEKSFVLAYHVRLFVDAPMPANWEVFVDAQTGEVVDRYNSIHTGDASASAPMMMADTNGSGTSTFGGTLSIPTFLSSNQLLPLQHHARAELHPHDDGEQRHEPARLLHHRRRQQLHGDGGAGGRGRALRRDLHVRLLQEHLQPQLLRQ